MLNANKQQILHIMCNDKFSSGYINFMKISMTEWKHEFVLLGTEFELKLINYDNIYSIKNHKELLTDKKIRSLLKNADKIIISGFFSFHFELFFMRRNLLKKIYIHLWGGDFYNMQDKIPKNDLKLHLKKFIKTYCFKKCAALIFLINGEYEKFTEITRVKKRYFIAPMPKDPYNVINYSKYWETSINNRKRILVGNSATVSNKHIEIFEMLKKYKDEDIQIICPLSYGNEEYRQEVKKKGEEILGDIFCPILHYIEKEKYIELLSTCTVGIFNNNRQQAMGNINIMLYLGKKLYLRTDVSMWDVYQERGYDIFSVETIPQMSIEEFFKFSNEQRIQNHKIGEKYMDSKEGNICWKKVFESV